ncbi:MAG TPA: hypothetical protein VGM58_08885 [Verrucomicrobiae bacterium]|jgi:hypothetical protein
MQITIGKILGLLIAIGYAICAAIGAGGFTEEVFKCCMALLLPLALIWFPDEIGSFTGYFKSGYVNVETPAIMISFMGWFFLVGLPVLFYFLNRN